MKVKGYEEIDEYVNGGGGNGGTALHGACHGGYEDVVKYLINNVKVDILNGDDAGKTGSDYARENGHKSIAMWLSKLEMQQYDYNLKE